MKLDDAHRSIAALRVNPDIEVERFHEPRDTGHRNGAGWILFATYERVFWARSISGWSSDWVMKQEHVPWCKTGFEPSPRFSTGVMQRCSCPIECGMARRVKRKYPS